MREGGDSEEELLLFLLLGVEGSPAVATFTLVLMPGAVAFSDGDVLVGAAGTQAWSGSIVSGELGDNTFAEVGFQTEILSFRVIRVFISI